MKVACFVNPLVQARGPCFNFGWVETLANLLQSLRRDARCECMLIAGGWFKDWASQNQKGALLTGLRTVWIDELALYRRLRALGELPTAPLSRAVSPPTRSIGARKSRSCLAEEREAGEFPIHALRHRGVIKHREPTLRLDHCR